METFDLESILTASGIALDIDRCEGCGRPFIDGECLYCDGDGNPWDGHAALRPRDTVGIELAIECTRAAAVKLQSAAFAILAAGIGILAAFALSAFGFMVTFDGGHVHGFNAGTRSTYVSVERYGAAPAVTVSWQSGE